MGREASGANEAKSKPARSWLARARSAQPGLGRVLGLVLLTTLIGVRALDPSWLEIIRNRTFDAYQLLKPRVVAATPVVIIDVDEKSLAEVGQWPWPRNILADLVLRLTEAGTVVVGLDIILAEPDRLSPGLVADSVNGLDESMRAQLKSLPNNESVLAAAMRRSRVVLSQAGQPRVVPHETASVGRVGIATVGGDPRPLLVEYAGLLRNRPELESAASGRGLTTIRPDRDGVIRRIPAVMVAEGNLMPALGLEVLRVATGAGSILVRRDRVGVQSVVLAGNEIPTDGSGQLWLHHAHYTPARYVSAADVLARRVGPEKLAGKLALVGSSSIGLFDLRTTPLERVMPGVEIHAQIIENIVLRSLLIRPNYAVGAEIAIAAFIGLGVIVFVPMFGALTVLLLGAGTAAALAGGSWYLFDRHKLLIDVAYPLMSSFLIFLFLTFQNYLREEARRNAIRGAFAHYLSPALVEQLARDPDKLVLGGETRETTVLFSDVRGFTTIAESFKGNPQGLTSFMNRLLTPLSNAILDRQGTIDKYMGDAILAFWNAPVDDPDHASHSCLAALDMLGRLDGLNESRRKEAVAAGKPFLPIHIGIGLNTGTCVVGNMGSDVRFDYSVLGDSVNIASRIEALTKSYGVPILIGSETARKGAAGLAVLAVDVIRVKGKTEPETIYALLGDQATARSPWFEPLCTAFAEMRQAYGAKAWMTARRDLALCRQIDQGGRLSGLIDLYLARIETFETESPPPDDWDGVFTMETKTG